MPSPDFLEGCIPAKQFASTVGKTYKTLYNWMSAPNGLPYLQLGRDRYIHIDTAREWLFDRRMRRRNPPRPTRKRRLATEEATI